jgi:hypothetical protein
LRSITTGLWLIDNLSKFISIYTLELNLHLISFDTGRKFSLILTQQKYEQLGNFVLLWIQERMKNHYKFLVSIIHQLSSIFLQLHIKNSIDSGSLAPSFWWKLFWWTQKQHFYESRLGNVWETDGVHSRIWSCKVSLCLVHDKHHFIYTWKMYIQTKFTISLFVHGYWFLFVSLRPGVWARSLCINDSLRTGSMFPYFDRAIEEGYGIIVLNPNLNSGH